MFELRSVFAVALLLCSCILSPANKHTDDSASGSVKINLDLEKTKSALSKVSSADTIFRMDSLFTTLSSTGQTSIISNIAVSGRSDSSNILANPLIFNNLASLRTWTAKFLSLDTVFVRQATSQSGTSTTITLDVGASATNSAYNGRGVYIVSGAGAGQVRLVSSYVGATKIATVNSSWSVNPNNTSVFRLYFRDTVHIDSVNFFIKPADTLLVSKTLNSRFSILRVRVKSDSAALIPSAIRKIRLIVDAVVRDSVTLNSKTFDQSLTYKYLTPNVNHTLVIQAFDNVGFTQGYERTKSINIPANKDTTVSLDTIVRTGTIDTVYVRQATCQAGSTSSTIKLDASASNTNSAYNVRTVMIMSGVGAGQERVISAYVGATKVATVTANWVTIPTNTSVFRVSSGGTTTTAKLDAGASNVNDNYTGMIMKITSGTGSIRERTITDYIGSTKIVTISPALSTILNHTSTFSIYFSLIACGRVGYPACTP